MVRSCRIVPPPDFPCSINMLSTDASNLITGPAGLRQVLCVETLAFTGEGTPSWSARGSCWHARCCGRWGRVLTASAVPSWPPSACTRRTAALDAATACSTSSVRLAGGSHPEAWLLARTQRREPHSLPLNDVAPACVHARYSQNLAERRCTTKWIGFLLVLLAQSNRWNVNVRREESEHDWH